MPGKITEYSTLLRAKKISSAELTKAYLDEIGKSDKKYNSFVSVDAERAMKAAALADEAIKRGEGGLLTGIPYGVKNNIAEKGVVTDCCSKILENYRPTYNAAVIEKLNAEYAVPLGKNNMDEFAMGSSTETSVYGATLNPVNTEYVPGGSSGGGAAAVRAGLAAFALGSDTGGSVRQPAAFTGIVGLKPTYGAVSRYGLIAYGSSLDQIGPLTTSVKDAAAVYDAIRGADKRDMTSSPLSRPASDKLTGDVKKLRIGYPKEYFEGIDPEVKRIVESAFAFYEKAGAEIKEVCVPILKSALPAYYIIACAEASSNLGRYDGIRYGYRATDYDDVNEMIMKTRSAGFGKEVKRRIMLGTYVLSAGYFDAYYKQALRVRESVSEAMRALFDSVDVLLTPVAPTTAFPLNYTAENMIETYMSDFCTVPVNIAGLPAVSLPAGNAKSGLPVGMQLIGARFTEDVVLNAAYAYETEHPVNIDMGVRI